MPRAAAAAFFPGVSSPQRRMHYLNRDIAEKTARECYPEIRDFTYDILWNDLPKEVQEQLEAD